MRPYFTAFSPRYSTAAAGAAVAAAAGAGAVVATAAYATTTSENGDESLSVDGSMAAHHSATKPFHYFRGAETKDDTG